MHKLAFNYTKVCHAFPKEDLKDLYLDLEETPPQRTFGVLWSVSSDTCEFQVSSNLRPYTKRGVLETKCHNSIYDPVGFLAPIVKGKIILHKLMS